jgi:glycosyltransferase A (GT-A) superfamily protein (DUF2064 family)
MRYQIVVVAKAPQPGRVKTRLCPPCTPEQAARLAGAALADSLAAVTATPDVYRRILLLDGDLRAPPGYEVVAQRGDGLDERLAHGYLDTASPLTATVLIGMDTPQVSPELLSRTAPALEVADAVLGLADDGGWWMLGLRDPAHGALLRGVPMSRVDTGERTQAALREAGLRVAFAPPLRDVDTIADAYAVAAEAPRTRFAAALAGGLR